jgi:hypothetical protein
MADQQMWALIAFGVIVLVLGFAMFRGGRSRSHTTDGGGDGSPVGLWSAKDDGGGDGGGD